VDSWLFPCDTRLLDPSLGIGVSHHFARYRAPYAPGYNFRHGRPSRPHRRRSTLSRPLSDVGHLLGRHEFAELDPAIQRQLVEPLVQLLCPGRDRYDFGLIRAGDHIFGSFHIHPIALARRGDDDLGALLAVLSEHASSDHGNRYTLNRPRHPDRRASRACACRQPAATGHRALRRSHRRTRCELGPCWR